MYNIECIFWELIQTNVLIPLLDSMRTHLPILWIFLSHVSDVIVRLTNLCFLLISFVYFSLLNVWMIWGYMIKKLLVIFLLAWFYLWKCLRNWRVFDHKELFLVWYEQLIYRHDPNDILLTASRLAKCFNSLFYS